MVTLLAPTFQDVRLSYATIVLVEIYQPQVWNNEAVGVAVSAPSAARYKAG